MGGRSSGGDRDRGQPQQSPNLNQPDLGEVLNVEPVPGHAVCSYQAERMRSLLDTHLDRQSDPRIKTEIVTSALEGAEAERTLFGAPSGLLGVLIKNALTRGSPEKTLSPEEIEHRADHYQRTVEENCTAKNNH